MSSRSIPISAVDMSILMQISEQQVQAWMHARVVQLQSQELSLTYVDFSISIYHHRENGVEYRLDVSMQAAGNVCVIAQPTTEDAFLKTLEKIAGNPADLAAEKRASAKRLMEEASLLDEQSKRFSKIGEAV